MEIAKFILTAVGTFVSVFGISLSIFQYWKKKQDEKFDSLKKTLEDTVDKETKSRSAALERLGSRLEFVERSVVHNFEKRLGVIEGELRGMKPILQAIQNWFINNTPTGRK